MLTHVKTPSGDLIARHLIDRVTLIPKKCVVVKDSFDHILMYMKIADLADGIRVRDLFNEVVLAGRNAEQPDWSFLTSSAPASAAKAKKLPKESLEDGNTTTEV